MNNNKDKHLNSSLKKKTKNKISCLKILSEFKRNTMI